MPISTTSLVVTVGTPQTLEMTQGEDREFDIHFQHGSSTIDFTGAQSIILTVRNRATNALVMARSYSGFISGATGGTPYFRIGQSDTSAFPPGPYSVDVFWTDASGYREQILAPSTFQLIDGIGETGDPVTTPPSVPVVYGLNWLGDWTGKSGGYGANDAIDAYDGSLGATAISSFRAVTPGVTGYPVTGSSQIVASGWAYVGQHGGISSSVSSKYAWGPWSLNLSSIGSGGTAKLFATVRSGANTQQQTIWRVPFDGFVDGVSAQFEVNSSDTNALLPNDVSVALYDIAGGSPGTNIFTAAGVSDPTFLSGTDGRTVDLTTPVAVTAGQSMRVVLTDPGGGTPTFMGVILFWRMRAS